MATFTCTVAGFFVFACASPEVQVDTARFCQTAGGPIRYSLSDTAETKRQVRAYNAKGVSACGWGKR